MAEIAVVAVDAKPAEEGIDPFFANDEDVLKTYTFDYDQIVKFDVDLAESMMYGGIGGAAVMTIATGGLTCPCLLWAPVQYYVYEKKNIDERVRAQHLAITRDGIKYVVDKHPSGCRMECQMQGKTSKTVPFDKLTDCDIEEPAGSAGIPCMLVKKTLYVVQVDTASGARHMTPEGGGSLHELSIAGLMDVETFKRDVWTMKRGEPLIGGRTPTVAPGAISMVRDDSKGGGASSAAIAASNSEIGARLDAQTAVLTDIKIAIDKLCATMGSQ